MPHDDTLAYNPVGSALGWTEGTLLGVFATTVAVIAVAWLGFLMLTGRIDIRRSAQVIFGCFIIFGASMIAGGIHAAIMGGASDPSLADIDPPPYYPQASPVLLQSVPAPTDPYAGTAVPSR